MHDGAAIGLHGRMAIQNLVKVWQGSMGLIPGKNTPGSQFSS